MNLYEISEELLSILSEVEDNEGELTPELEERLTINQEEFKSKAYSYATFIKELEGRVALANTEIERINRYKKGKQNLIETLKANLLTGLQLFGEKDAKKPLWRMEVGTFKLGTRRSEVVNLYDETVIEDRWKRLAVGNLSLADKVRILEAVGKSEEEVKLTIDIPKTPIKDAIKAGEVVNGASVDENFSLQIK